MTVPHLMLLALFVAAASCNSLGYRKKCGATYVKATTVDGGIAFHTIVGGEVVECSGP